MEYKDHNDNHVIKKIWVSDCDDCVVEATAIDWLLAVRKYGLETANRMFP